MSSIGFGGPDFDGETGGHDSIASLTGVWSMRHLIRNSFTGILALALSGGVAALAQSPNPDSQDLNLRAYIELLRSDVRAKKVLVMTEVMDFTEEEGAKFWPIYQEYDVELSALNDRKVGGIKDYAANYENMTEEKAKELTNLALQLEAERVTLKKKYIERIGEALSPKMAGRFLQVENQLLWIIDLQISSSLPVIQ
jgi:hypothetical protein